MLYLVTSTFYLELNFKLCIANFIEDLPLMTHLFLKYIYNGKSTIYF